jgi:radical SAM superfamily enzyme YgiQ (UPF0313 family)
VRVLIVAANTERINLPTLPLGAALVAAAAEDAGHEISFLDLMGERDPSAALRRVIEDFQPAAVGVSVRNIDDQEMACPTFLLSKVRPVVEACRAASQAPVILGGAGFTLFPQPVLDYLGADYGISGEGEDAFPALLDRLERGRSVWDVPGLHAPGRASSVPRAAVTALDALPDPGPAVWATADLDDPDVWVPVQTRRGCPYRCSYCSTPRIEGGTMRCRSPRLVVEQLARIADAGVQQIQFVDNVFNVPRGHAIELCRRITELGIGLRWQALLYPHGVDKELVSHMTAAGCRAVSLGFEAGDDRMLRAYGKHFGTDEVRRAAQLLADHGIRRFGFLLLGGPGETRDTIARSFDFVESLGLDMLKVTIGVRIYPDTPIARLATERGVVARGDDLLQPSFYMEPGLEAWTREELERRALERLPG